MALSITRLQDVVFHVGPKREDNALYQDGALIESSKINHRINAPKTASEGKIGLSIEKPVYYLGVFYTCWGNCITDNLKFLWPFTQKDKHPFLDDCLFVYSKVKLFGKDIPPNFTAILDTLGVPKDRLLEITDTTLLRQCYLADESYVQDPVADKNSFTPEYTNTIDFICKKHPPSSGTHNPKVYFTRTSWDRWEYGEKSIEDSFRSAGYSIFAPEKLSLAKMISILQGADVFASFEGSCAHNSIFLRPATKAILLKKLDFVNKYQASINVARNLDVMHINANISFLFYDDNDKLGGPFFMYPSKQLRRFLGTRWSFPIIEFIKYLSWGFALHYGHLLGEFIRRHKGQ